LVMVVLGTAPVMMLDRPGTAPGTHVSPRSAVGEVTASLAQMQRFFPGFENPEAALPKSVFTQFLSEWFGVFVGKNDTLDGDANHSAGARSKDQFLNPNLVFMALAVRMQELVDQGEVADYAELARLAHVSRARITQIMNLLLLASDIQEAMLFLPLTVGRRVPIGERHSRPICAVLDWRKQRRMWDDLVGSRGTGMGDLIRRSAVEQST